MLFVILAALGVGGLIQAYKYAAQITLESAVVVSRTIDLLFQLTFGYDELSKVMRIIKEKKLKILHQAMGVNFFLPSPFKTLFNERFIFGFKSCVLIIN